MERKLAEQFQIAKKAAKTVSLKGVLASRHDESQCVDTLNQLKTLRVTSRLLASANVVKPLQNLTQHRSKKIRSAASSLLETWTPFITRTRNNADTENLKPKNSMIKKEAPLLLASKKEMIRYSTTAYCDGTASRDQVRGLLVEALRKVTDEVDDGDEEMMKRKLRYSDPIKVADSVERVLFEKLGTFNGDGASPIDQLPKKIKYKLIMFAMNDPENRYLRRKVLVGEISPEKLVDMKAEEMRENRRRREINKRVIKESALLWPIWC